jgi:anti-sigma factor RsiW
MKGKNTMRCPIESGDESEWMVAKEAGSLAPEQEAELEKHLESCARCRELAESQRVVWSALDSWPPVTVSQNFDERLFRRIATEQRQAWWKRWPPMNWSWRPTVPVGVACAVLMAAFLVKSPVLHNESRSRSEPKLQIEQVEHALDDMEMLKQLEVEKL